MGCICREHGRGRNAVAAPIRLSAVATAGHCRRALARPAGLLALRQRASRASVPHRRDPPAAICADTGGDPLVTRPGLPWQRLRVDGAPHTAHAPSVSAGKRPPAPAVVAVPMGPLEREATRRAGLVAPHDDLGPPSQSLPPVAAGRRPAGAARHGDRRGRHLHRAGRVEQPHDGLWPHPRGKDATGSGAHRTGHRPRRCRRGVRSQRRRGPVAWHVRRSLALRPRG